MNLKIFRVSVAILLLTAGLACPHVSMAQDIDPSVIGNRGEFTRPGVTELTDVITVQLTMSEAIGLALAKNPLLSAFFKEIGAREGALQQTGLFPNPELVFELENFGGSDVFREFDGVETTVSVSQLVELGGKRKNRQLLSSIDKTLAEWDYQSKKLDVLSATAKAFMEVLIAQKHVILNNELLKLAQHTADVVSEKVDAGKVSPVEKSRANIELAVVRTEAEKTVRDLESKRRRLAGYWGSERAGFLRVEGQLDNITELPPESSFRAVLDNNPDLARWSAEIKRSEASLSLAYSEAVPDFSLSFGVRNFQETDSNAFLVGISIPIPLFNRNQGGIIEAQALAEKARLEQQATRITLMTDLSDAWQSLSAAYTEVISLRDEILPNALRTFESTELGYREGKFDLLQMLDAQRTLFTVKRQHLLALGNYLSANIDIERITGIRMHDFASKNIKGSE
ncbi:MAG: TolC family protein [Desulfatiglans sp.]|jgi:cobalt-zinc-cadmium efflux system outer membrane protein|nr:TolC family protein [Desulfatiglans sp.]